MVQRFFFLLFPPNKKKKTVVHNFTDFTPAVRRIIFCRTTRTTNRRVPDKLPTTENRLKIAVEKAIFSRKLIFFYLFFTHIYNIISGTIYDLSMFRTIRVCTRGRGIMNVFVHSCVRKHILSLSLSRNNRNRWPGGEEKNKIILTYNTNLFSWGQRRRRRQCYNYYYYYPKSL